MSVIKSISFNEQEIIKNILLLHCYSDQICLDPCYSKGNFYKGLIKQPIYKYDINPQTSNCSKASADNLDIKSGSLKTIMFDPPFLATTGKSLQSINSDNIINKRFGVYPSEKELFSFYINAMAEFYRILDDDGILIFKCQDKVSSGKQYWSHTFIQQEAEKLGFYSKDLFILLAKNRVIADWQTKNQQHSRKYHSYFWVFKKCSKKIKYIS